jgi:bifunctional DNA-binding transcriptional regulator/antitoxin component of YhaV-PrlF toxin-antitoxin module
MTKVININHRGTLTIPKEMRVRFGLKNARQVVAEETRQGILIRTGVAYPVEIHTNQRLAEFDRRRSRPKTK